MSTEKGKEKLFHRKVPNQIFCILIKDQGAIHTYCRFYNIPESTARYSD